MTQNDNIIENSEKRVNIPPKKTKQKKTKKQQPTKQKTKKQQQITNQSKI